MKNLLIKVMAITLFFGLLGSKPSSDPANWSDKKVNKWFDKGEWLEGWSAKPHESINKRAFAVSYYKNPDRWQKAFEFFKTHELKSLEVKRYDVDGNNLYALVQEYQAKALEMTKWELHQKYIDIQYVISGKELMGAVPLSYKKDITEPYSDAKDIEFCTVTEEVNYKATPETFFVFFPEDIHKPGMVDVDTVLVRKLVMKVKID